MLLLKLENFIEINVVLSNTSLLSLLFDILSWVFQIPLDGPDVIKCEVYNVACGDPHRRGYLKMPSGQINFDFCLETL